MSKYGRKKQDAISISDHSRSDNFNYKEYRTSLKLADWKNQRRKTGTTGAGGGRGESTDAPLALTSLRNVAAQSGRAWAGL